MTTDKKGLGDVTSEEDEIMQLRESYNSIVKVAENWRQRYQAAQTELDACRKERLELRIGSGGTKRDRTHWADCWRDSGHHACAVAEIERLQTELRVCNDKFATWEICDQDELNAARTALLREGMERDAAIARAEQAETRATLWKRSAKNARADARLFRERAEHLSFVLHDETTVAYERDKFQWQQRAEQAEEALDKLRQNRDRLAASAVKELDAMRQRAEAAEVAARNWNECYWSAQADLEACRSERLKLRLALAAMGQAVQP